MEIYDVEANTWSYGPYTNVDARDSGPSIPRGIADQVNGGNGTSVGFFVMASNGYLYYYRCYINLSCMVRDRKSRTHTCQDSE